jgi:hypothetical protein
MGRTAPTPANRRGARRGSRDTPHDRQVSRLQYDTFAWPRPRQRAFRVALSIIRKTIVEFGRSESRPDFRGFDAAETLGEFRYDGN